MRQIARAANLGSRRAWLLRNRSQFGTTVASQRPQLLVDVSAIIKHDAQTGIQRVVRSVWSELARRSGQRFDAVPVYATATHGYCYAPDNFLDRDAPVLPTIPVRVSPGDRFLALDLSAHLLPKYRAQLKAWRAYGATLHFVVYDLLPLLRPDWFSSAAVGHFRKWFQLLSDEADQAICISDQVARDLREKLPRIVASPKPTIGHMDMGGDISASEPSTGVCDDLAQLLDRFRFRPAILMVGTVEPRKGYDAALAAFERLWASDVGEAPDLVIVGKSGWKTERLQEKLRTHPERGRRLHWFDQMSDEGLCLLYDACRGVLMASRAEGFGLPVIEAALHRRYVLARDLPVFREQNLPNVSFFTNEAPLALANDILALASRGQKSPAPTVVLPTWSDSVDGLLQGMGLGSFKCEEGSSGLSKRTAS